MIEIDWNPSERKLRQFAVASLFGFPLLGFMLNRLLPLSQLAPPNSILIGAAGLGAAVCLVGLIFPRAIRPVYVALTAIAFPIGLVLGFLLLPLIYFGVLTPISLLLRALGKDPMNRTMGQGATYWIKRPPAPAAASYFRQY